MTEAPQMHSVDEVRAQGFKAVLAQFWWEITHLRQARKINPWGYLFIAPAVLILPGLAHPARLVYGLFRLSLAHQGNPGIGWL